MKKATPGKQGLKIVGHRGVRGLAPEHTVIAINKALEAKVDEIEVDVRITKDGVLILHHDPTCQDASGNKLVVREASFDELLRHKPDLITLEQAIELINRQVPLQIEIKAGEPVEPTASIIKQYLKRGWRNSDFLIGSKSQRNLLEAQRLLPDIEKVVIEACFSVVAVHRARQLGATRLSMQEHWLWGGFIRAMSHRGYQLYAYPLNDPQKAKRWHSHGLTGTITDFPDRFDTV